VNLAFPCFFAVFAGITALLAAFSEALFALEDACNVTASFALPTAAFASKSCCRMSGALSENRSSTSETNSSAWANRLTALSAFMIVPARLRLVFCDLRQPPPFFLRGDDSLHPFGADLAFLRLELSS
jgi:hypothetical protein